MLRDARRIGEYYPDMSPESPESMDRLGVSLAHLDSKCANFYDPAEAERIFYPEIEPLLLEFFPGATDAQERRGPVLRLLLAGWTNAPKAGSWVMHNNATARHSHGIVIRNSCRCYAMRVYGSEILTGYAIFGLASPHYEEDAA